MEGEEKLDITKLKYVMYLRKSSEDEAGQKHSIEDQKSDCLAYAKEKGLKIAETIEEKKSAKIADNRPEFKRMMKELKSGKYDGILAWHPDRLSRNMLEAGQIIDYLDNGVIKDLQFVRHAFENNASGKMMLGMLFVFSKQYSDSLSERVTRGVHKNLEERGLSGGTPKWGYERDKDGHYRPDKNFDIIKEGWRMRIEDKNSCSLIYDFFKSKNVSRTTKEKGERKTISKTTVENIFKDPFYFGLLMQGGKETHLSEHYDFQPMITQEEYEAAQDVGYAYRKKYGRDGGARPRIFKPLVDMVYCGVCNDARPMSVNRSMPRDKSGYILYFTCRNPECPRCPKNVQAGYVFDAIYELFDSWKFDDAAYERYAEELGTVTEEKIDEISRDITSKVAVLKNKDRKLNEITETIAKTSSGAVIERLERQAEVISIDMSELRGEIEKLKEKVKSPERIKLAKEDFLNLLNSLGNKMRNANAWQKDQIARKIFLNLTIDNEKRLTYRLKEPFDVLIAHNNPDLVGADGIEPSTNRL